MSSDLSEAAERGRASAHLTLSLCSLLSAAQSLRAAGIADLERRADGLMDQVRALRLELDTKRYGRETAERLNEDLSRGELVAGGALDRAKDNAIANARSLAGRARRFLGSIGSDDEKAARKELEQLIKDFDGAVGDVLELKPGGSR